MEQGGKNSFAVWIRCRGQLVIGARAVFLRPLPAGSWSKAALTTSDFIQFVFGGEGHFKSSGCKLFPWHNNLLLSPLTLHTHPNNCKEETHFLMSSLCRGFISKNKQMTANQSFFLRKTDAFAEEGLVFLSPPLLFSLVVGLSNWVRLLFGLCLLTASEFFLSTQDCCGLMRGSEPSEEIPYPQLCGPM